MNVENKVWLNCLIITFALVVYSCSKHQLENSLSTDVLAERVKEYIVADYLKDCSKARSLLSAKDEIEDDYSFCDSLSAAKYHIDEDRLINIELENFTVTFEKSDKEKVVQFYMVDYNDIIRDAFTQLIKEGKDKIIDFEGTNRYIQSVIKDRLEHAGTLPKKKVIMELDFDDIDLEWKIFIDWKGKRKLEKLKEYNMAVLNLLVTAKSNLCDGAILNTDEVKRYNDEVERINNSLAGFKITDFDNLNNRSEYKNISKMIVFKLKKIDRILSDINICKTKEFGYQNRSR